MGAHLYAWGKSDVASAAWVSGISLGSSGIGSGTGERTVEDGRERDVGGETNLREEDALGLQVDGHAMPLVIQEVFKPQELNGTHVTMIPP